MYIAKGMDVGICLYMVTGISLYMITDSGLAQASSAIQLYPIFVRTVRDIPDAATATAVPDCSGSMHKPHLTTMNVMAA